MSFRLTTILWVFALLAAAMATFGAWGIVAALGVVGFWIRILSKKPATFAEAIVILLFLSGVLSALVVLFLLPWRAARETNRQAHCMNNLIHISMALQQFAANRGEFPAASAPIVAGAAPASWRLRLLPRLDQQWLFDQYLKDELSNLGNNHDFSQQRLDVYQCPSDVRPSDMSPHTDYFAIVGEDTAWPPGRGRRLTEIEDGSEQTILLLEVPGREVSWAEPRDLTVEEAVAFLTNPDTAPDSSPVHLSWGGNGFFYHQFAEPRRGVHVAFANGRVGFLPLPISRELAEALMTVDGGEDISDELARLTQPKLNYAKIYAFGMFVLLALLPVMRLFGRKHALPSNAPAG